MRKNFWEQMEKATRELDTELGREIRHAWDPGTLGQGGEDAETLRWAETIPEYLDAIREAGLEPAPCLIAKVMNTMVLMPVRLDAIAHDGGAGRGQEHHPLELTILMLVPECEVPGVKGKLSESSRAWNARGTTSVSAVAEALAEASMGRAGHQRRVQPGMRLREIYRGDLLRKLTMRIFQRRDAISREIYGETA